MQALESGQHHGESRGVVLFLCFLLVVVVVLPSQPPRRNWMKDQHSELRRHVEGMKVDHQEKNAFPFFKASKIDDWNLHTHTYIYIYTQSHQTETQRERERESN